nr:MAG TPA: hypothetical protein [Caudoviricetes sp.]
MLHSSKPCYVLNEYPLINVLVTRILVTQITFINRPYYEFTFVFVIDLRYLLIQCGARTPCCYFRLVF